MSHSKTWLKIMTSLERSESHFSADAFLFNVPLNLFNWPFRLHHVMIFGHAANLWFSIWLSLDRIGIKFIHTHTYTHSCNSETWGPPPPTLICSSVYCPSRLTLLVKLRWGMQASNCRNMSALIENIGLLLAAIVIEGPFGNCFFFFLI